LSAEVKGIREDDFEKAAQGAKENCPISKLPNCDLSLNITAFTAL